MIFPQLGPQFYDDRHKSILSIMEKNYAESITINQSFWGEADTDTRFEAGDQTLWNDIYGNLPANRRRQFNFNRIRRVINMISGHQRRNRKSTVVTPVENADQITADQFTKILYWVNQQEGVLETISEAFHGALVTGMNLLQIWVDYRKDPVNGNIRVDNCPYNSFLIDPFFRKADLSDCNFLWKRSYLTKLECISLLPNYEDEIAKMQGNQSNRDGKFQFQPESYSYGQTNHLTYDEYYYRDYRTQKLLVDTQTGETFEWTVDDNKKLKQFLQLHPVIKLLEQTIPTVRLSIVVQGKVMYDGPNPLGTDKYPFIPVFAYYNPQMPYFPWRIQGVVRGLRDSQFLYNRRKVIELDILESQVNSGWIYKEDALVNPKDVFLSGQGRGLALKQEANMADVQQIQAPQIPPSMIELSKILAQEIQEISGVNEELLGSAVDDKAGILAMVRQGAGLTTLQVLFDNLDRAQKLLGKVQLDIVQANFTPGKIARIINEKPSDQFYNKTFGTYDAAIEEGTNTTTQRQTQFIQLLHLKEIGIPVPDSVIIKAMTIENKNDLVEAIEQQNQQAQQAQQAEQQAQLQEVQARIDLTKARTVADQGLGVERMSRVEENKQLAVERRAQAIENIADAQQSRAERKKDDTQATLNLIKSLKELESVDIENVGKLLSLAQIVKTFENEKDSNLETSQTQQQIL